MAEAAFPRRETAAAGDNPAPTILRPFQSFFRVILPTVLQEQKLKLPLTFVRTYREELGPTAKLSLPNGFTWEVSVEKGSEKADAWFCKGWSEFVERHSISYGFFLVFDFVGGSEFKVQIFNLTTCSIRYPSGYGEGKAEKDEGVEKLGVSVPPCNDDSSKKGQQLEEPCRSPDSVILISDGEDGGEENGEEDGEHDDVSGDSEFLDSEYYPGSRPIKKGAKRRRKSQSDKEPASSGFDSQPSKEDTELETKSGELVKRVRSRGIITSAKFPSTMARMYRQCKEPVEAALLTNPRHPSFISVMFLRKDANRLMTPTVPTLFVRRHLGKGCKRVTLVTEQKEWEVDTERKSGVSLGNGWTDFYKDNGLKPGDICLFQMVCALTLLFEVSVFRSA